MADGDRADGDRAEVWGGFAEVWGGMVCLPLERRTR